MKKILLGINLVIFILAMLHFTRHQTSYFQFQFKDGMEIAENPKATRLWQKILNTEVYLQKRGLYLKKKNDGHYFFSTQRFDTHYAQEDFISIYREQVAPHLKLYTELTQEFLTPALGALEPGYHKLIKEVEEKKQAGEKVKQFLDEVCFTQDSYWQEQFQQWNQLRELLGQKGLELSIWDRRFEMAQQEGLLSVEVAKDQWKDIFTHDQEIVQDFLLTEEWNTFADLTAKLFSLARSHILQNIFSFILLLDQDA